MPHDVFLLETVLSMLERQNAASDHRCWETSYMLLLWLSILCKAPFDLSRFDNTDLTTIGGAEVRIPIQERLFRIGKSFLGVVDGSRDMAAVMLSELVTRPDCRSLLARCMCMCLDDMKLLKPLMNSEDAALIYGYCLLIANCLKKGRREDMLDLSHELLVGLSALPNVQWPLQNAVLRKLWVKVLQRIALISLKPIAASWRYRRGVRSLTAVAKQLNGGGPKSFDFEDRDAALAQETAVAELNETFCTDVETVISLLLEYIPDRSLAVHWSAAKGLGRITFRLPHCFGADVVHSLLDMFETFRSPQSENFWHGGCLALAELGRRGLLLPAELPKVMSIVDRALVYDEFRGNYSVGSIVRDAACYLSWSFARAYEPDDFKPYVTPLARTLVCVALFDREVNCRRAASAAFQEHVGRQGSFPHGIEIFTKADFFAVGKRHSCYLEYSVFVAQFVEYTRSLIDHLVKYKVSHWDEEIRRLASQALGLLAPYDLDYIRDVVLEQLLATIEVNDSFSRQGALYALGFTVVGLTESLSRKAPSLEQQFYESDTYRRIVSLPSRFYHAGYFAALNNAVLRKAFNEFAYNLSSRRCPASDAQLDLWLKLIRENLCHKDDKIRDRSADALKSLCNYGENGSPHFQALMDSSVDAWLSDVKENTTEARRIGGALALGNVSNWYIEKRLRLVTDGLIAGTKITRQNLAWVDGRKQCLVALKTIVLAAGLPQLLSCGVDVDGMFRCYADACIEYTIDMRGDAGKVVRQSAVCCLEELFSGFSSMTIFTSSSSPLVFRTTVTDCIGRIVQQCCEKIATLRFAACTCMARILAVGNDHSPPTSLESMIPDLDRLRSVFLPPQGAIESVDWLSDSEAFPKLVALLDVAPYRRHVLIGFVLSAGGVLASTAKHASASLMDHVRRIKSDDARLLPLFADLCDIFDSYRRTNRVVLPLMTVLDTVLSCDFIVDEHSPEFMQLLERLYFATVDQIKSGNVRKVLASLAIFCDLMQFDGTELAAKAMSEVLALLVSKYPVIRRSAATQLYEAVLSYVPLDNHTEHVLQMLSETNWDASLTDLQPVHADVEAVLRRCCDFSAA